MTEKNSMCLHLWFRCPVRHLDEETDWMRVSGKPAEWGLENEVLVMVRRTRCYVCRPASGFQRPSRFPCSVTLSGLQGGDDDGMMVGETPTHLCSRVW